MREALAAEAVKLRRSRLPWITAIGFTLATVVSVLGNSFGGLWCHAPLPRPKPADKGKGPPERSSGPSLTVDREAQASANASSSITGPLSWPLADTSRSTNSMMAIGAASLARMPALITRV